MKQPEWQRGGICGALSSTSQQLNLEPSEQRERERLKNSSRLITYFFFFYFVLIFQAHYLRSTFTST